MAEGDADDTAFTIHRGQLGANGLLSEGDAGRVAEVLRGGGFVLLPSDTAYAVAVLPVNAKVVPRINAMLRRPDMPVSLAFGHADEVRRWVLPDPVVEKLLMRFCPGPITIVCRAAPTIPDVLLNHTVKSRNQTIGVRISSSRIERQVAALTAYPITTIAVRDPDTNALATTLTEALELFQERIDDSGFGTWCAIEGDVDYDHHSTVVEVVPDDHRLERIRDGAIPFEDIRAVADGIAPPANDHVPPGVDDA